MSAEALPIRIGEETLWMHPDRAVIWPAQNSVIVADTHFGKSQIFRRNGMAVPAGVDARDRQRLQSLLQQTGATRLLVLGDFLHGALASGDPEIRSLEEWLEQLPGVRLSVIAGNHDRHVLKHWQPRFDWHTGMLCLGSLKLVHDAETAADSVETGALISGHIHPVWQFRGSPLNRLRVPVFWRNALGLVLPAFGSLSGGYGVRPADDDELYVAAGGTVLPVPKPFADRRRGY